MALILWVHEVFFVGCSVFCGFLPDIQEYILVARRVYKIPAAKPTIPVQDIMSALIIGFYPSLGILFGVRDNKCNKVPGRIFRNIRSSR